MRIVLLILAAVLSLCSFCLGSSPVELAIESDAIVLQQEKKGVIPCVIVNKSGRNLFVPRPDTFYYGVNAVDVSGSELPRRPEVILELAEPAVEHFVMLPAGGRLRFELSVKTTRPTQEDLAEFRARGAAIVSDGMTQFLIPRTFNLSVSVYAPDRDLTRAVRRKIRGKLWEGKVESSRVKARIK